MGWKMSKVSGWVDDGADFVGDGLAQGGNYLSDKVGDGVDYVGDGLNRGADYIGDSGARIVLDPIGDGLNYVGDALSPVTDPIADGVKYAGDRVSQLGEYVVGAGETGIDKAGDRVAEVLNYAPDKVTDATIQAGDYIAGRVDQAGDYVGDRFDQAGDYISGRAEQFGGFLEDKYNQFIGQGQGAIGAAGQAQFDAATRGANAATAGFDTTAREFQPYQQAGLSALEQQQQLLSNPSSFQESPGQRFLRERGERSLLRNSAAIGGLGGGNVRSALQEQGIGFAAQDFNNQFNRLGSLAGRGQDAAGQVGQFRQNAIGQSNQLNQNAANAQAQAALAQQQSRANLQGQLLGGLGTLFGAGVSAFGGSDKPQAQGGIQPPVSGGVVGGGVATPQAVQSAKPVQQFYT